MKKFSLSDPIYFFQTWEDAVAFLKDNNPGKDYTTTIFYSETNDKYTVEFEFLPMFEKDGAK